MQANPLICKDTKRPNNMENNKDKNIIGLKIKSILSVGITAK